MALDHQLTFAGIPFVLDAGRVIRMGTYETEQEDVSQLPPRRHQPLADLIDEIDRIVPFQYLQDFGLPPSYPGYSLSALAYRSQIGPFPNPQIRIGDWYYPTTACRWSVFRGLATGRQVKAMLNATGNGTAPGDFVMKAVPIGAIPQKEFQLQNLLSNDPDQLQQQARFTLESELWMLPPRPLAELATGWDGLYLVTLVDERYHWQYAPVTLHVERNTTWQDLIDQCAFVLHVDSLSIDIPEVYTRPEPDSHVWAEQNNAAILLDAIAYNIGDVVVRNLRPDLFGGSRIKMIHPTESQGVIKMNRGDAARFIAPSRQGLVLPGRPVLREAGGNLFQSGDSLPAGDLTGARNLVVPATCRVSFPQYVAEPVPHFVNSHYANPRPSAWYEENLADSYDIDVPLLSGNFVFPDNVFVTDTSPLSGLVGVEGAVHSIHSTAKALYPSEDTLGGDPSNVSGLTALAMQLAADFWNWQCDAALDEVYPGTFNWVQEGFHDIIWSWSARSRQGSTRVLRTPWNQMISEMQHATPALAGFGDTPVGVGGRSVAQTWRDQVRGTIPVQAYLVDHLTANATVAEFISTANLPTQNRWRGSVDAERILFEGTSGGLSVDVVYRGIDGTLPAVHIAGTPVTWEAPNHTYGVNLVTFEKGQHVYPAEWTSGGIQGVNVVPQTQTVLAFDGSGVILNGIPHYSGEVRVYDPTQGGGFEYLSQERVWLVHRNSGMMSSGKQYEGQFAGWSPDPPAPVYLVGDPSAGLEPGCGLDTAGGVLSVDPDDLAGRGLVPGANCEIDFNPGCGLRFEGDEVWVNPADLAGFGLGISEDGCQLDVQTGCGLGINNQNRIVVVNTLLAGRGLDPVDLCSLEVALGCGLAFDEDSNVKVDNEQLAGAGLLPFLDCALRIDPECTGDSFLFSAVTSVSLTIVACSFILTRTTTTYQICQNAGGAFVGASVVGSSSSSDIVSLSCECICMCDCDGTPLGCLCEEEASLVASFTVTFQNGTGDCDCLNGKTATINVIGDNSWAGLFGNPCPGGTTHTVGLSCEEPTGWRINGFETDPNGGSFTAFATSVECDPLVITFTGVTIDGDTPYCTGTIDIVVTPV